MLVAVHDGARPLVSEGRYHWRRLPPPPSTAAAAPVVPVKDSIKRIEDGNIAADVARDTLAAVQTRRCSCEDLLRRALTSAAERGYSFTDDCAAVESLGTIVKDPTAATKNIKITTPEDYSLRKRLTKGGTNDMRIGHGYDVAQTGLRQTVHHRRCWNIPFEA